MQQVFVGIGFFERCVRTGVIVRATEPPLETGDATCASHHPGEATVGFTAGCILTCKKHQGCQAGESRGVQVEALEVGGEIPDGVQPLSKAAKALESVQHRAVAEHQFVLRQH